MRVWWLLSGGGADPEWFFFSSSRRHTGSKRDWSSDVCSSDLGIRRIPLHDAAEMAYAEVVQRDPSNSLGNLGLAVVFELTNRLSDLSALVGEAEARGVDDDEIGRASCRERGRGAVGGGGRTVR